jgi:hypothetical protein
MWLGSFTGGQLAEDSTPYPVCRRRPRQPAVVCGVAVIAGNFARIHEANLTNQGLLALTFQDPAGPACVGVRVSLPGLARLSLGKPVACRNAHADSSSKTMSLMHSYSSSHVRWLRAGSANEARQPTSHASRACDWAKPYGACVAAARRCASARAGPA